MLKEEAGQRVGLFCYLPRPGRMHTFSVLPLRSGTPLPTALNVPMPAAAIVPSGRISARIHAGHSVQ